MSPSKKILISHISYDIGKKIESNMTQTTKQSTFIFQTNKPQNLFSSKMYLVCKA